MSVLLLSCLTGLFFFALFILTSLMGACRQLHDRELKQELHTVLEVPLYGRLHRLIFPRENEESLLFVIRYAISIMQWGLLLSLCLLVWRGGAASISHEELVYYASLWAFLAILPLLFFADFIPRFLGMRYPKQVAAFTTPLALPFLLIALPFCGLFLNLSKWVVGAKRWQELSKSPSEIPPELLQLLQEASSSSDLAAHDRKLFEAVAEFRKRIAREVMVPRVDLFSLSSDTSIREAAHKLEAEGYSRTPVYRNGIDDMIGVLMWKDILHIYLEAVDTNQLQILEEPIETIIKPPLYTPETKRISHLLQEFRTKQVHLAIVVDEYGGTEGIVTIEDILEQLVGDISDEYDKEEPLFTEHPEGGWIIDPRLTILEMEEHLGIQIPQEGEYDTVAGYIFHCAGAIPTKGFVIHHDTFRLEILESNPRSVDKVLIQPVTPQHLEEEETSR